MPRLGLARAFLMRCLRWSGRTGKRVTALLRESAIYALVLLRVPLDAPANSFEYSKFCCAKRYAARPIDIELSRQLSRRLDGVYRTMYAKLRDAHLKMGWEKCSFRFYFQKYLDYRCNVDGP